MHLWTWRENRCLHICCACVGGVRVHVWMSGQTKLLWKPHSRYSFRTFARAQHAHATHTHTETLHAHSTARTRMHAHSCTSITHTRTRTRAAHIHPYIHNLAGTHAHGRAWRAQVEEVSSSAVLTTVLSLVAGAYLVCGWVWVWVWCGMGVGVRLCLCVRVCACVSGCV